MFEEDYTVNYMALLACITSKEFLSANRAIRKVLLENVDDRGQSEIYSEIARKLGQSRGRKTIVIDILENKEYEFESSSAAERFLGAKTGTITSYIKKDWMYKKRYIFRRDG